MELQCKDIAKVVEALQMALTMSRNFLIEREQLGCFIAQI